MPVLGKHNRHLKREEPMKRLSLVKNLEPECVKDLRAVSSANDRNLRLRLLEAFVAVSDRDRAAIVEFAENLVDPIWDY